MPGFDDLDPDQQQQPGLGDDNPLGDIDPMAWLESLAARQGATEGFTTSHDMDIPEIDPSSVVINEPGYTPYELGGSQKPAATQPAAAAPQPEPEPPAPQETYAEPAPEPMAMSGDDFSLPPGVDPLKWLESLAARQGATEGFTTSADMEIEEIDPSSVVIDEPGYTPSETIRSRHPAPAQPPAEPVQPAAVIPEQEPEPQETIQEVYAQEPEPVQPMAMGDDFTLPPGVDPLKWLESLAARQGATEGFMTSADMEIEEIDPSSVVIDEPGYTPSETIRSRHQPPAAPPAPEPAFAQASEPVSDAEDFLSSLVEPDLEGVQLEFAESGDTIDWLDSLVEDSAQVGAADLFDLSEGEQAGVEDEALPATHTPEQVLASIDGLSDDEIARLQAQNRLTPEQELAWLQRQAMRAHENRMALETEADEEEFEAEGELELGTAEAGEIPPWLQNVTIAEREEEELSLAFTDDLELPPQPEGLPDWLREDTSLQADDLELPEFTLESTEPAYEEITAQAAEVDLGFLNLEAYDPAQDEWASALDEEHDRMVSGMEEEHPDWFANAMQQVAAEEDIVSGLAGIEPEPEPIFEPEVAVPLDEQITPGGDLPDWLAQVADEPSAEVPEDLPEWLRPAAESATQSGDLGIDEWLRQEESSRRIEVPVIPAAATLPAAEEEELAMADTGPLPAWVGAEAQAPASPQPRVETPSVTPQPTPAAASRPQPAATPAAQPQPSRQAPRPAAPPPQPRQRVAISNEPVPAPRALAPLPSRDNPNYGYYVAQLETNPEDTQSRLYLARGMYHAGEIEGSLSQYETLVEQMGVMEDTTSDLLALSQGDPVNPRIRRLLGDAYMRQGYLQEALDAYRGALDNL